MTLQNLDCKQSCSIDLTEAERVVEQIQLDASKTSLERNRLGQFATPNLLAIEILKYSKTLISANQEIHFLDPAIGTGSFYSALLQSFSAEQINQLDATGELSIEISGKSIILTSQDVEITSQDIPGWLVANANGITVALDITISEELKQEGIAR